MMFQVILGLLSGLVLFLFGINQLSSTLIGQLEEKAKSWLSRFTRNTFMAILTGTLITVAMDSSSAVIVLAIVLVNARAMTLRQAMGIVLGANLGTTAGSQIIALNVSAYAPLLMVPGYILLMFKRSDRATFWGKALLHFGMIFMGLTMMGKSAEPLQDSTNFASWLEGADGPLLSAAWGALITLILQSSSATIGMMLTLAKQGLVHVPAGIAIMLGAELGTCGSTLLATIKGTRDALKTGVFHALFNALFIGLGLALYSPFVAFITQIAGDERPAQQIAIAHIVFNCIAVIAMAPWLPLSERLLNRLIPQRS